MSPDGYSQHQTEGQRRHHFATASRMLQLIGFPQTFLAVSFFNHPDAVLAAARVPAWTPNSGQMPIFQSFFENVELLDITEQESVKISTFLRPNSHVVQLQKSLLVFVFSSRFPFFSGSCLAVHTTWSIKRETQQKERPST